VYRSPWADIKNVEQLNSDVAQAERAVGLARELGQQEFVQESLVVQGYIRSLKALYELRAIIKPEGKVPAVRSEDARGHFKLYADSLQQVAAALPRWEETVRKPGDIQGFTDKPIEVVQEMLKQMAKLQTELGL
jgi:hypothetical protein